MTRTAVVATIVLVLAGCRGRSAKEQAPPPPGEPDAAAPVPLVDGWGWTASTACVPGIELAIPPGWTLVADQAERCHVGTAAELGATVSQSDADSLADWAARGPTAVLSSEELAGGWLARIALPGQQVPDVPSFVYVHNDALDLMCIGRTLHEDLIRRICLDSRPTR